VEEEKKTRKGGATKVAGRNEERPVTGERGSGSNLGSANPRGSITSRGGGAASWVDRKDIKPECAFNCRVRAEGSTETWSENVRQGPEVPAG